MHLKSQWKLFCSNEVLHFEKQKSWETKGKKRFEPFEMFRRLVRAWQHRLLTTGNCRCCTLQVRYGGFCILLTIARLVQHQAVNAPGNGCSPQVLHQTRATLPYCLEKAFLQKKVSILISEVLFHLYFLIIIRPISFTWSDTHAISTIARK